MQHEAVREIVESAASLSVIETSYRAGGRYHRYDSPDRRGIAPPVGMPYLATVSVVSSILRRQTGVLVAAKSVDIQISS
jgi:hypothetical protein